MAKGPKLKTHKSTAKRFKVTGTGKLMRSKIGKGHFRRRKSRRVLRKLDQYVEVEDWGNVKRVRRLAPTLWH